MSVVTNEKCTLIRVKRETFRDLWEQNLQLIENSASSPINESLNYSFSASLPSKLPIRSYSQSCSSISGRQSTSPENSKLNMLAVDFKEANSDILTAGGSSRNSFSSQNTETNLLVEYKTRHSSEGALDQSVSREHMNQLIQVQSSSSTNLKSNLTFNQPLSNFEQTNNQQSTINQSAVAVESKQDAFSRRKSFRRSTLRKSSYRTAGGSSAYEESDINATVLRVAKVLRTLIQYKAPYLIRDRCLESPVNYEVDANNNKNNYPSYLQMQQQQTQRDIFTRCMIGSEMVDWLLSISANTTLRLHSRFQAASMLQVNFFLHF